MLALNPLPLLELDPDVLCSRSCGRVLAMLALLALSPWLR